MLNFEQLFHSHCNITSGTYKEVGGWEGGRVGGGGGWAAGGGLYFPLEDRHQYRVFIKSQKQTQSTG